MKLQSILAAALLATVAQPAIAADDALRIIQFDFEGAGGTLFITPDKRTLLVDTGWPAGFRDQPVSNAQRIANTLREEGIGQIDYLLTSHYHLDHIGGFAELVKLVPVGTFLDHGLNREHLPADANERQVASAPATRYPQYVEAIGRGNRLTMVPGERISIGEMTITATNSDRRILQRPLPGAGQPGTGCAGIRTTMERNGGEENPRSLGFIAEFGNARIILLGDTTSDIENQLVCPVNLIGHVDLMIATHHGFELSNEPVVAANLQPRVAIIPNGETKGGDPITYDAFTSAGSVKGLYQVHEAVKPGAKNVDPAYIANISGVPDAMHPILVSIDRNGTIAVTNPRTNRTDTYPKER